MHLKSLTLKGFKSFADATTLDLEPGITVVVGPNGSGKSNIVDAVAWVLGAQGPRTVRSSKMDDVIFAGTDKRSALGRAEVSLTIDNSDGQLPIAFSELTVRRTLFRSGDSEYAINGVACRLLDVQDLLSDSGVGRQQHVIVSQGQIDGILNARPEDRRAVIEEAAGVLKFRRRKERAERRLEATEANLVRLSDLLRELRRQLRPLERQAEAARRHGDLVAELAAVCLFLAGRELASLRTRLGAGAERRAGLSTEDATLKSELSVLDAGVLATEAELSAMGAEDLGDSLVRVERAHAHARGLAAVLAERLRGTERDIAVAIDLEVVATLEADAARLRSELDEAEGAAVRLVPETERVEQSEADLRSAHARFAETWGEEAPIATGRAAEVRGELAALRSAAERAGSEAGRARARLVSLESRIERLDGEARRLRAVVAEAEEAVAGLRLARDAAASARADAEAQLDAAETGRRAADADRHAWAARAEALGQALDQARARAGAERLEGVDGVVGILLDLVEVDDGWEPAVEAALGQAIDAVVVRGGAVGARRALEVLHEAGTGAVLPLGVASSGAPVAARLPVGERVRDHVRSRDPEVDAALDAVLGAAVCVPVRDVGPPWLAALDAAVAHPGAVVVTRSGDRFAAGGWRIGATGAGATGAALEEAVVRAAEAAATATDAEEAAIAARAAVIEARAVEVDAARRHDRNEVSRRSAADGLARVDAERADAALEAENLRSDVDALVERAGLEQGRLFELDAELPALEAEESSALERAREMADDRARLEERAAAVRALRTDLEVRASGLEERRAYLHARLAEVDERLSRNVAERADAESRRIALQRRLGAVRGLAGVVEGHRAWLDAVLDDLREQRRAQSEAVRTKATHLDHLRKQRTDAEGRLSELRERSQRAELECQELQLRVEASVESIRRELDSEPDAALAAECPPLPEATTPAAHLRDLERELRLMGPINPLALEEHDAVKERHGFVESQLEDVKAGRRELARVIRAVDAEIVETFTSAFADVSGHFTDLFETLFPGGQGRLCLTDPDHPLDTGIDIEARPSGKNVRKLSLLSGGERSLTALAYLFAVFRSRPSPFYLMDEVEAALDDVNLRRFLDLVDQFRQEAQLVIVTHQKRTMEVADVLYGVTMQSGGSSKVVSERVTTATT
ncbi:MAG: chromosome segregation protein SMC [Acidimicrobiales bacterium]